MGGEEREGRWEEERSKGKGVEDGKNSEGKEKEKGGTGP